VPSPIHPPSGCRFHPRCPKAQQRCVDEDPDLVPRPGDTADHLTACHYPVDDPEEMIRSKPTISEDERIVEPEAVSQDAVMGLTELTERGTP
jgi:hypothetical protein